MDIVYKTLWDEAAQSWMTVIEFVDMSNHEGKGYGYGTGLGDGCSSVYGTGYGDGAGYGAGYDAGEG